MNLSFFIQPGNNNTEYADLYIEVSTQGLSFIILDYGIAVALAIYHFETGASDETAAGYIHQIIEDQHLLQEKFNSVHIIYSYSPAILVPQQFLDGAYKDDLLALVFGEDSERVTRTDIMQKHAIHNVYGIPAQVEMALTRYFGYAECSHIFSLLPDTVKEPGNHLYCIFSSGQLKVLLVKDGKMQVMQNYNYSTPEDVAYHLLNLCKIFDVNVSGINVRLSGMIDASSALYTELLKYFLLMKFDTLPAQYEYPDAFKEYPDHYFSHLFSIAACV